MLVFYFLFCFFGFYKEYYKKGGGEGLQMKKLFKR